jgi:acetyltransferase-like isoleucine patch superfamily enzyme
MIVPNMVNSTDFGRIGRDSVIYDRHLSLFLNPKAIEIGNRVRIDGGVRIEGGKGCYIGNYVHIATGCKIVGGGTFFIGSHSGMAADVIVATGMPDLNYQYVSPCEDEHNVHPLRGKTEIGRYVVVFAGARILPNVQIDDYAIVGMGAVVTKDVPTRAIVAGNPAEIIGWRGTLR